MIHRLPVTSRSPPDYLPTASRLPPDYLPTTSRLDAARCIGAGAPPGRTLPATAALEQRPRPPAPLPPRAASSECGAFTLSWEAPPQVIAIDCH